MPSKKTTGRASTWLKSNLTDIVMVFGAVSAFYGVYRIYPPAAFIALGGSLIYWAILSARNDRPKAG